MKIIVTPDAAGVVSAAGRIVGQVLTPGAVVVEIEGESLDLDVYQAAIVHEGELAVVSDYRGTGPWYDQRAALADRLTQHKVLALGITPPNDEGRPVSIGWEHMAMTPRALSKAEKDAQAQADAQAAAQAEAERVAQMSVTDVQFGLACVGAGIITVDEAEAWVARGVLPQALAAAIDTLPEDQRAAARIKAAGERVFVRSSPFVVALGAAMGKTPPQIDALFVTAASL